MSAASLKARRFRPGGASGRMRRAPILLQGRTADNKYRGPRAPPRKYLRACARRRMPPGEANVATRRTTRVFIETHECWVVRRPEQMRRAWCAGCGEEAE